MSSDPIRRLDSLRSSYKVKDASSSDTAEVRELREIKAELKVLNDERAMAASPISSRSNSPYLPDQEFFYKETVYNSNEESSWKDVKSYDELYSKTAAFNLKKLNIL